MSKAVTWFVTAALVAGALLGRPAAASDESAPDSVESARPVLLELPVRTPAFFQTTSKSRFLEQHAYTFDHFLQYQPEFVLVRRGPIGSDAAFSRYGVGRGRGLVLLDGIPINDPQNDVAPVECFPVSGVGSIATGEAASPGLARTAGIEGVVRVEELAAPESKPTTFFELSKGTNNLRQRRVRFSSARSNVGIDLAYDELLNDGYSFDANQNVGIGVPDFGSAGSRYYSFGVRGEHPLGETYSIDFRKFTSSNQGDLVSSTHELRRSGYLASARTSLGRFNVTLFERGYDVSYPDSHTVNTTNAAYASFYLLAGTNRSLAVEAGYEDIVATQRVHGAVSAPRVSKTSASVEGLARAPMGVTARAYASGADYHGVVSQWGAGLETTRDWKHLRLGAVVRRSYRMPNLGELYLPAYTNGSVTVSGNKYLDAEFALEAGASVAVVVGPVTNEVRWTTMRVSDPVVPLQRVVGGGLWVTPVNGGSATLRSLEERLRLEGSYRGVEMRCEGGAVFTEGDRYGFFRSAPATRVVATGRVGGSLFDATSALYAGVEYVYGDERIDYTGERLPSYEVINLMLDGRLINANMYLALFNVRNVKYRSDGAFLMTPRTFVYGIAWTLWE